MDKHILITGGAGFIGSHVVRLFVTKYPQYKIVNLDALTYAGNLENLKDIEAAPNYQFEKGDIIKIVDEQENEIGLGLARYDYKKAKEVIGMKNQKPIIHYDHLYLH